MRTTSIPSGGNSGARRPGGYDAVRIQKRAVGVAGLLAVLPPAGNALASDARAERVTEEFAQAEEGTDVLVEDLNRALGMTPAAIEALGLSPGESSSTASAATALPSSTGTALGSQGRTSQECAVVTDGSIRSRPARPRCGAARSRCRSLL